MKTRKSETQTRGPREAVVKHKFHMSAIAQATPEEPEEVDLQAQDGDSVPQPLDDWADNDDTNRWLDEHRCGDDDQFNIN